MMKHVAGDQLIPLLQSPVKAIENPAADSSQRAIKSLKNSNKEEKKEAFVG